MCKILNLMSCLIVFQAVNLDKFWGTWTKVMFYPGIAYHNVFILNDRDLASSAYAMKGRTQH